MKERLKGIKELKNKPELILLVLIFFLIGAFIEFSYGSVYIGVVFFCICLLLLYRLSGEKAESETRHKSLILLFTGALMILTDLAYNYLSGSAIQTLDTMILLLGASLIAANSGNSRLSEFGAFGMYMSLFFLVFFASLYIIPSRLNIGIPHYYGHYFIALPVCAFLKMFGLDLEVPEMNMIAVRGVEQTCLKLDLACFGWYSLLLIVSTLLAYSITIEHYRRDKLLKIILVMIGASYVANLLRVSVLVALAYYYGVEIMMVFHSHLGWIIFAMILIPVLYFLMEREDKMKEVAAEYGGNKKYKPEKRI